MTNTLLVKRSAVPGRVPTTAQLALGELGINTWDGKLYLKQNAGSDVIIDVIGTAIAGAPVQSVSGRVGAIVLGIADIAGGAPINSPTFTGSVTIPSGSINSTTIGSVTPSSGAFTTLAASGTSTLNIINASALTISGITTLTGGGTSTTPAVDNSSTNIATTAYYINQASAINPLMNSAVAIGTSLRFARADHVHPVDTSRAPLASPLFTGTVTIPGGTINNTSVGATTPNTGAFTTLSASSTLGITGTATLGVINASGLLTLSGAGTALSVTNNATIGGTLGVTGISAFSGVVTANNGLTVGTNTTVGPFLTINGAAASTRNLVWNTAGVRRWQMYADASAETGADAGTNFLILGWNDAATINKTIFSISRATGLATFAFGLTVTAGGTTTLNTTNINALNTTTFATTAVISSGVTGITSWNLYNTDFTNGFRFNSSNTGSLINTATAIPITLTTTDVTTVGTNILTFADTTGVVVGMYAFGTNIPLQNVVTGVTPTTITLLSNVTGAGVLLGDNIYFVVFNQQASFQSPLTGDNLRIYDWRFNNTAGWSGTSKRIQMAIGTTDQAFIEFNPSGYAWGLALGGGRIGTSTYGLYMLQTGQITLPATGTALTVTNNATIGGTLNITGVVTIGTLSTLNFSGASLGTRINLFSTLYGISINSSELRLFTGGQFSFANATTAGTVYGLITSTGINSTAIGATTRSTGAFTTLSANAATTLATATATTPALNDNSTNIATTAYYTNQASAVNPLMNSAVAIGISLRFARADHVHPTDTTLAPINNPTFTGTVTIPAGIINNSTIGATTPSTGAFTTLSATGISTLAITNVGTLTVTGAGTALTVNNNTSLGGTLSVIGIVSLTGGGNSITLAVNDYSTNIATTAYVINQASSILPLINGNATTGISSQFSREDHIHPTDISLAPINNPTFTGTVTISAGAIDNTVIGAITPANGAFTNLIVNSTLSGAAFTTLLSPYALLASPTFTGIPAAPTAASGTNNTQIATTAFVIATSLDQLTIPVADVSFNNHKIINLLDPTNPQDATTKNYVDSVTQGLQIKPTANLATAVTLPANTYYNGIAGFGSTLTANANGVLTVDGVTVTIGMLILVKNETASANNGLYVVTQIGIIGTTPYILTRHNSMNTASEIAGAFIPVAFGGTVNSNSIWLCNPVGAITIGITGLPFTQLTGATGLIAGNGINISGNTLSAVGIANRITVSGSGIDIAATYVGQSSITTLGTITTGVWNATDVAVTAGGTGVSTLTGYVKGSGTNPFTASATIPNTDITGLGTISTQAASAVAITGGTIVGAVINATPIGATTTSTGAFTTLSATGISTLSGGTSTTPALDDSSTNIATTAYYINQASAINPLMNSAVAIGTSLRFSRADHVHPMDTSRAPVNNPTLTGAISLGGHTTIGTNTTSYWLFMNGPAGVAREITWQTAGINRWILFAETTAEIGSNIGSNLQLNSISDAGAYIATPLSINRATGLTTLTSLTVTGITTLGTITATTLAVDNSSTNVATTAYVIGQASSVLPITDGTATIGISTRFARADHIHPVDITRAPLASPTFTGTVNIGMLQISGTNRIQFNNTVTSIGHSGQDGVSPTANDLAIQSTWGIGFFPGLTNVPAGIYIPQTMYSHWFNARVGDMGMYGAITSYGSSSLIGAHWFSYSGTSATINTGAWIPSVPVVTAGGTSGFAADDLLIDIYNNIYRTLTVTAGVIQTLSIVKIAPRFGATTNPLTLTVKSGVGIGVVTATVTWTQITGLILNPSGSTTISGAAILSSTLNVTGLTTLTTATATTPAVDNSSTNVATTAYVIGQASAVLPLIDGAATIGISTRFARADHIHPVDTSRAALASPTFTGTVTIPAGVINATTIGAITPSTGAFTTLSATGVVSGVGFTNLLSPYALLASPTFTGTVTIPAGIINATTIGATAPSTGAFTTLSASGVVSGVGFTNLLSPYATLASPTFTGSVIIPAGIINSTTIGATTPSTGAFTTLSASGVVSGAGFTTLLLPYATLASPTFTGTVIIPAGIINNSTIGATTPSTGAFTTLSASGVVSGAGFTTLLLPYATLASPTFTGIVTIPGGVINATTIGITTPSTGAFTTLSASGVVSGTGFTNLLSPYALLASPTFTGVVTIPGGIINATTIGAITPSTGAFTTLSASGVVSGTGFTNLLSPYALLTSPTFTGTVTVPILTVSTSATIPGYLTTIIAASTYAPLASPTFTGVVTIPTGALITGYALLASPTFTGIPLAPTATNGTNTTQLATTAFVLATRHDQLAAPTADVSFNNRKITNLLDPTNPQDAATKNYVDVGVQGLKVKSTADYATVAALPANTYNNGAAGVGATLTANAVGILTIDSVAIILGKLILVKNEAASANNGLYLVTTAGTAGIAYVLTRNADFDTNTEIPGAFVPIASGGTVNSNTLWLCNPVGAVTMGTTGLPFTQLNSATSITAGNGISVAGTTITAVGTANRITISSSGIDIAATYVGQTSITTLGTITTGVWNSTNIGVAYGGTGVSTLTGYIKGSGASPFTASATIPNTDITGLGTISTQAASAVAITGGAINATTIGATTASTGAFTTLSATGAVSGAGFTTLLLPYALLASPTFTGIVTIPAGVINATTIGAITPSTGSFTTLSASGIVSGTGFTNLLSPYALLASPTFTGTVTIPAGVINASTIGSITPSTGAFTTLSATGIVSGAGFTNLLSPYALLASPTFTGTVTIPGGVINATTIGATTPSTGSFTTLSASGVISGTGFTNLLSPYALRASPVFTGSVVIPGGTIDATTIGATTPSTGAFTTISASGVVSGAGITILLAPYALLASPTFTGTVTIPGGVINNTTIGATTPNTGAFTTLSATGAISGIGFSNYLASPPAIGGTAPAAGSFTTLSATGIATLASINFAATTGTKINLFSTTYGIAINVNEWRAFTLAATGTFRFADATTAGNTFALITTTGINATAIGATTPNTGAFTTLSASGLTTLTTVTATTPAVDDNSINLATTGYYVGQASGILPIVSGTATIGTSLRFARADHIHPSDNTRAPINNPTFTGTVTIPAGATIVGFAPLDSPVFINDVNIGTGGATLTNALLQITGNSVGVIQASIQNLNAGNNASGDIVVTADNGSDTVNYVNLGINSSTNNDATFTIAAANDAYLYTASQNLVIGTASAAKTITFFTSGTLAINARAIITDTGLNNAAIGVTIPSTGAFTTLSATGVVSGVGFTNRFAAPGPIGNTTPSTGAFTTLSATGISTLATTNISALNTTTFLSTAAVSGTVASWSLICSNMTAGVIFQTPSTNVVNVSANAPITLITNAITTTGTNILNFADTTGVVIGMYVYGTNIPITTVTAVTPTTVTLLANTTGTGVASAASIYFVAFAQQATFYGSNGNISNLRIYDWRFSNAAGWTGAAKRIQHQIDVSDMGFIEFNPSGFGLALGYGRIGASTYGLQMSTGGLITLPAAGTALTVTNNAVINGTLSFGAILGSRINLFSTTYGIAINSGELRLFAAGNFAFASATTGGVVYGLITTTGINATAIGITTPSTGAFTTLSATGLTTLTTATATTPAVDNNSTNLATTAYYMGQVSALLPIIDGTAAIGASLKWARADHVHPTDTTRAALASPTFTGSVVIPGGVINATTIGTTTPSTGAFTALSATGLTTLATATATTPALNDSSTNIATTAYYINQASSVLPASDGIATIGISLRFARADHVHPSSFIAIASTPPAVASSGAAYWNNVNGKLYVYTGTEWVVATNDAIPIATASNLGAVKIGTGLSIDSFGLVTLSSINNIPIGNTVRSTGAFTSLNASTTLVVTGNTTLSNLTVTGVVSGTATLTALTVTGATILSSTLNVTGAATLSSTLTATGNIVSTGGICGTGASAVGNAYFVSGNSTTTGYVTFSNSLGAQQGYIGFAPTGGPIVMTSTGTSTGYSMIGTGNFYTSTGAKIHRFADRVFIGGAVTNNGSNSASTWLGGTSYGLGTYFDTTSQLEVIGTVGGVSAGTFGVRTSDGIYWDSMAILAHGNNDASGAPVITFSGTISGTTLTVSGASGSLFLPLGGVFLLFGSGVAGDTKIGSQITGPIGGDGTYNVNISQSVGWVAMTAYSTKEVWGIYTSAVRASGFGIYTAGFESDVTTTVGNIISDPFHILPSGVTTCMTLAGGGETAMANVAQVYPTTAAITIITAGPASGMNVANPLAYTGAGFRKGIVFASNSLVGVDGSSGGWGTAMEMVKGHALVWKCYPAGDNDISGMIRADCTDPAYQTRFLFSTTQFKILGVQADHINENVLFAVTTIPNVTTANAPSVQPSLTGSPPIYTVQGSDSNIDLAIFPKGSGLVWLGNRAAVAGTAANFRADHYIAVRDGAGSVVYLACSNGAW